MENLKVKALLSCVIIAISFGYVFGQSIDSKMQHKDDINDFYLKLYSGLQYSGYYGFSFNPGFAFVINSSEVGVHYNKIFAAPKELHTYEKIKTTQSWATFGMSYKESMESSKPITSDEYENLIIDYRFTYLIVRELFIGISTGIGYEWGYKRFITSEKKMVLQEGTLMFTKVKIEEFNREIGKKNFEGYFLPISLGLEYRFHPRLGMSYEMGFNFNSFEPNLRLALNCHVLLF